MTSGTPGGVDPRAARPDDATIAADLEGTRDTDATEPTPGSDNDGAEVGYVAPADGPGAADGAPDGAAGSDDPVSD